MPRLVVLLAAIGAVAISSCAARSSTEPGPADTAKAGEMSADEGPVVGPPEVAWADMSKEQRGHYMKKVVAPKMAELFREFDPKEFAEVKCVTCHGDGAKDKTFKMPNPNLPDLPTTKEGFEALAREKGATVKFMAEKVKPTMARLLDVKEFDPANPQAGGFGCANCHPMEKH